MNVRIKLAIGVAVVGAMAVAGASAFAGGEGRSLHANLSGYQEVPAVSTGASGTFKAKMSPGADEIKYAISYTGLEGDVTQSHIHFGQTGVNGGISVFFCSNLGNGPAGTQACPPSPATVEGTINPGDVIGPNPQGIALGEFDELVRAIKAGKTYVNVHSTKWPGGEVRSQLRGHRDRD